VWLRQREWLQPCFSTTYRSSFSLPFLLRLDSLSVLLMIPIAPSSPLPQRSFLVTYHRTHLSPPAHHRFFLIIPSTPSCLLSIPRCLRGAFPGCYCRCSFVREDRPRFTGLPFQHLNSLPLFRHCVLSRLATVGPERYAITGKSAIKTLGQDSETFFCVGCGRRILAMFNYVQPSNIAEQSSTQLTASQSKFSPQKLLSMTFEHIRCLNGLENSDRRSATDQ
jgi:hypothetical protein